MAKHKVVGHKPYWINDHVCCSCGNNYTSVKQWAVHYAGVLRLDTPDESEDDIRSLNVA